ncbi:MAG: dihydroorotase [Lachnospiraceae bacterium]|nr:dihydroorotase [Lachnospiraceae bacterium]
MKILIKGGRVVNPGGESGEMDILMEEGVIVRMGKLSEEDADRILNAEGCIVSPGLVDVHAHFRDPGQTHKEDIESGAAAAKRGGYTSIVLMANTLPPVDNAETLRYVLEKGTKTGIHIYSCANITMGMQGTELTDFAALKEAGALGFTDDGKPLTNGELVREAMERAARLGLPLSFHEEDPRYIGTPGFNRGAASEHFGLAGADRMAEIVMIERDIALARESGAVIDIQHISTKEGVELVRQARKDNPRIHAEATPHHFSLTEVDAVKYGVMAKMNPPLRTEEDRQAIVEGLSDGSIDLIATDHAPHTAEEKAKGITEAPSGIIGLETALALANMYLVETGKLDEAQLVERMSLSPARLYGLDAGVLACGKPADMVIWDPAEEWIAGDYASRSSNTPFTGRKMKGKVRYTICKGETVYADVDGSEGLGQRLEGK